MSEYLTVKEYAELRKCSVQYVKKIILEKKLYADEASGKGGMEYHIPVSELDPKMQAAYKRKKKLEAKQQIMAVVPDEPPAPVEIEKLTADERAEIEQWKSILKAWKSFRADKKDKPQADADFIKIMEVQNKDIHLSYRILNAKWAGWQKEGEIALLDKRGKHGNHRKVMDDAVFTVFQYYYLDESQPTVAKCMKLTEDYLQMRSPELLPVPSIYTFAREIERQIDVPVLKYFREGEKAFRDKCAPYIRRTYGDLYSNDIWVCDNHTFDVMVNDSGETRRVYLTGFLDVRSRKMMGWYVTLNPCSDATLFALRRGIMKFGIPKRIYSDNGREFLTHDIGGRGFRAGKKRSEEFEPPTILQRLGIEFKTAMVRNAKAKIIERAFLDVKEDFSKSFAGYTGGTTQERPERLKKLAKNTENFTALAEFIKYVDTYIEGIFNKNVHTGVGMNNKCPDQVYAENLVEQRVASEEDLNLLMMRNSRMQKVTRTGVVLELYGERLDYWCDELILHHIGEKVYYRYDPDDLSKVRIYDEQDRFIMEAPQRSAASYIYTSKEELKDKIAERRTLERTVKSYKRVNQITADSELDVLMHRAEMNLKDELVLAPKVIIPIRAIDESNPETRQLAAAGAETIDWEAGLERLRKAKGE